MEKEPKRGWNQNYLTYPLLVLVLIGAGWFYINVIQIRAEYNRIIIDLVNEEKYAEAALAFEPLFEMTEGEMKETVRESLIDVYCVLADDVGSSTIDSIRCFRRILELDPDGLSPWHMRLLEFAPDEEESN